MKTKQCDICGTEFGAIKAQKRCSPECSKIGTKRYLRLYKLSPEQRKIAATADINGLITHSCVECGNPFKSRHVDAKVCSPGCHTRRSRRRTSRSRCVICAKPVLPGKGCRWYCSVECRKESSRLRLRSKPPRFCPSCGDFVDLSNNQGSRKYCDKDCKRDFMKAHAPIGECLECGGSFKVLSVINKGFCSVSCASIYHRSDQSDYQLFCLRCQKPLPEDRDPQDTSQRYCDEDCHHPERDCRICGKTFRHHNCKTLTCSTECRKESIRFKAIERYHARRRKFLPPDLDKTDSKFGGFSNSEAK